MRSSTEVSMRSKVRGEMKSARGEWVRGSAAEGGTEERRAARGDERREAGHLGRHWVRPLRCSLLVEFELGSGR